MNLSGLNEDTQQSRESVQGGSESPLFADGTPAKDLLVAAGLEKTSWGKRIALAESKGFTFKDVEDANDWPTCACGAQDPRIPRESDGEPRDPELLELGVEFAEYVGLGDTTRAAATLWAIERRASIVIAEIVALEQTLPPTPEAPASETPNTPEVS